jgi:hypothetical protein
MAIFSIVMKNKMGMDYRIIQNNTEPYSTIINESLSKSILVIANIGDLHRAWGKWMVGMLAQDAFPFLAHEQREFLISGITPAEWHELFGNDDADDKDDK